MKSLSLDSVSASAGITLAQMPIDSAIEPLTNIAVGVVSALIIKAFAWLARRLKGKE